MILGDLITAFCLLLLYVAGDTISLDQEQRLRHVRERLTNGEMSRESADRIISLVNDYAFQSTRSLDLRPPRPSILVNLPKAEPPGYADSVAGLVDRAIASPWLYHLLSVFMDYLLFEQAIPQGVFDQTALASAFAGSSHGEMVKVTKNVFALLKEAAGFEVATLWPRTDGHFPRIESSQGS